MKQRARPLNKKLMPETYAHDDVVIFQVGNSASPESRTFPPVAVPVPLMYRLYHLGRAYDLPRLVALHPTDGKVLVPYVQAQSLGLELELVASIVSDGALGHYIGQLLQLISETRSDTKCSFVVSPGGAATAQRG